MIMTSYFGRYNGDNAVSIARFTPDGFKGRIFHILFPPSKLLHKFKVMKIISEEEFKREYHKQVLDRLNPKQIYSELDGNVLMCFEKEGDFCHRRVFADWIQNRLGIYVPEYGESFCANHGDICDEGRRCKLSGKACPYIKTENHLCTDYEKQAVYKQASLLDFL